MRTGLAVVLGAILLAPVTAGAARSGICSTVAAHKHSVRYIAIVSAFPAELAPLVSHATALERADAGGHAFYTGELAGVHVVLGLTGIGLVNAAATAETVLSNFDVDAILFSGVAGSSHVIGDVVVPAQWHEGATGALLPVNEALFALAHRLPDAVSLERCTAAPPPDGPTVCMLEQPVMLVGGTGMSSDPYNGTAFKCTPGAGEIFGCDLPLPAVVSDQPIDEEIAEDMETAAVARVAAAHDVPFLGFRGVSDGAGDPLNLPGFPTQFFNYYRLAAENSATCVTAFLEQIARLGKSGRSVCRLLARERWAQAAKRLQPKEPRH